MAAEEEVDITISSGLHMVSAFLAMEPPDVDLKWQGPYLKRFLKKLILEIESSGGLVLDELYEQYASYMISLQFSEFSFNVDTLIESSGISICPKSMKFEVQLQCSVNMLEGDTGCSIWPSSLFLSEFILSFPDIFANKCCFEVILSDGDLSTLANMKINLELNHLSTDDLVHQKKLLIIGTLYLFAMGIPSEDDLRCFTPDIILGADIIYDPSCLPHLVRVLSLLLKHNKHAKVGAAGRELDSLPADELLRHPLGKGPVAYVASVVRNIDTFNYFLSLAEQAKLVVTDLTGKVGVSKFLPYLRSYQRSTIRIFRIHV
ncbi:UNVERIFIED_CONTAM: putative uncharacterized protein DDB [Sesamum radiatum]|uniref:Uncharacterized protein n=1 Tax=Sesamum radiatum TaxID=300843 RepID=A0AAW2KG70_SESRA